MGTRMECGGGAGGNQGSGNGLGIGRRARGESQGVRVSALDDRVFNPDIPPNPVQVNVC